MPDLSDEIRSIRKKSGLSQADFAMRMEVSKSKIQNIETGKQRIDHEFLSSLAVNFTVDLNSLLLGTKTPSPKTAAPVDIKNEDLALVERMDLNVSAGPGIVPVEGGERDMIAFPRSWMLANRIDVNRAVLVKAKGDSMTPTIPNGAMILLDCSDMIVTQKGIYAFNRDGESFVKRLTPSRFDNTGKPEQIMITSDNPNYPPDCLSGEALTEINVVGRVRRVISDC